MRVPLYVRDATRLSAAREDIAHTFYGRIRQLVGEPALHAAFEGVACQRGGRVRVCQGRRGPLEKDPSRGLGSFLIAAGRDPRHIDVDARSPWAD